MATDDIETIRTSPERKRGKREVLVAVVLIAVLVVVGAVWTLSGRGSGRPELTAPAVVHSDGPATMPGPAELPTSRPGDVPPAPTQ